MKYIWMSCLLFVYSCNIVKEDPIINEDYDKLFPGKEIEKPENKRGELLVQVCDANQVLEDYKYPGMEKPDSAEQYTITLTCSFQELDGQGAFIDRINSRYVVRYINEKKELITINCRRRDSNGESESSGQAGEKFMYNGETVELSFTVFSGFPLYLSVTGEGPRNSNIKARIKAVSTDGLIDIPELETEQYLNDEGINPVRYPYCEYIVLP